MDNTNATTPTDALQINYAPREQFKAFHSRSARFSSLMCHRRSGKTVACVNDLGAKALYTPKENPRYAYLAPYYRQAKDVAWQYVKDFLEPVIVKTRESELRVELINGAWITLYGADNPDALRGIYLDGVILDEYGDCRPSLWGQVILPTLVDRGGWAVFIGTPKGKNHFYKMHRRYEADSAAYTMVLKASESGIIRKVELEEMEAQMSPEEYQQEMECSPDAALLGTYYSSSIINLDKEGHITPLEYNKDQPVHVVADLGYTDSTSMWFWQQRPDGIAIIDFEEHDSQPLSFYFKLLNDKPYEYEKVWLPPDARAKSLQTGRTTVEQFVKAGFPIDIVPIQKVQHGIDAARKVLPSTWFNSACPRMDQGLECLRAYRRNFSEVTQAFTDSPLHDWTSHAADAFRYFALVTKDKMPKPAKAKTVGPLTYNFSLDDLHKYRDEQLGRNFNRDHF